MRHSDFRIGTEFFTGAGKWRCTDVGTRVIVAVSLEPRKEFRRKSAGGGQLTVSSDPADLAGPPYGVEEVVFDEYDFDGCYLTESGHEA